MLADIVQRVLSSQADLEVVGVVDRGTLEGAVDRKEPEVVIVGLQADEGPRRYDAVLCARPRLKLLALSGDGREGVLYELRPHAEPLGEISPQRLIDAIRLAVRARAR